MCNIAKLTVVLFLTLSGEFISDISLIERRIIEVIECEGVNLLYVISIYFFVGGKVDRIPTIFHGGIFVFLDRENIHGSLCRCTLVLTKFKRIVFRLFISPAVFMFMG